MKLFLLDLALLAAMLSLFGPYWHPRTMWALGLSGAAVFVLR